MGLFELGFGRLGLGVVVFQLCDGVLQCAQVLAQRRLALLRSRQFALQGLLGLGGVVPLFVALLLGGLQAGAELGFVCFQPPQCLCEHQVVGRHGPIQAHVQHQVLRCVQQGGGDGQFQPRVFAQQHQHGRGADAAGQLPVNLLALQFALAWVPFPQGDCGGMGGAERDAVQVQKTGAIGRVQPQRYPRGAAGGYVKPQCLARHAHVAPGGEFVVLVVALRGAQKQFGGELRWHLCATGGGPDRLHGLGLG